MTFLVSWGCRMEKRGTAGDASANLVSAMTGYVDACFGVTESDWVYQGLPRGWSIAQTTEHVATTNFGISRLVSGGLRPLRRGEVIGLSDRAIDVRMFDDATAPPGPGPTGDWTDVADAIAQVERSMRALIEQANANGDDLRASVGEHPVFGMMDGVQWLLFAAVHTDSHRLEVEQLRALAAAPR